MLISIDEQLQSLLLIRTSHPTQGEHTQPPDPTNPPLPLLDFLTHLQISLEATYISPSSALPTPPPTSPSFHPKRPIPSRSDSVGRLNAIKRPAGLGANPGGGGGNPSIFPPATPNPTPATGEGDRKYVQAEGTLLLAGIWGQDVPGQGQGGEGGEKFGLLWSEVDQAWVAVYRLALTVCECSHRYIYLLFNLSNYTSFSEVNDL